MEAYKQFLSESQEQRIEEKKQKRKERRELTAPIRQRLHLIQQKKQAKLHEAMIVRPWEKAVMEMKDTFNWSMLKSPFTGQTDEFSELDLHDHFTPKTLLPLESWLFWNRNSWEDIPYLQNVYNPPEDSLAGLMRMTAGDFNSHEESDDEGFVAQALKKKEDDEIRDESGELKEHMILDAEATKLAIDHEERFREIKREDKGPENWIPYTDHGFTVESLQEEPEPRGDFDDTDTDIGEDDFVSDCETDDRKLSPADKLIAELETPDNERLSPEDHLMFHPILTSSQRDYLYNMLQVLINMPSKGQIKRWRNSVNPEYLELILKGARRAGLSAGDFAFVKEFLQNQREISNEQLEKFRHIVSPEFRNKLMATLHMEKDAKPGVIVSYDEEGRPVEHIDPEKVSKEREPHREMFKEEDSEPLDLIEEAEAEIEDVEFDLDESPVEDDDGEDEEGDAFDEREDTPLETADYFIDYAFRIKKILDYQMREQLMEFGLLSSTLEDPYMWYDPPKLGRDLDPCVEIIHTSHIQSLTRYDRLEHVQRKVIFKIKMAYLNFPPEVLERFTEIVGKRYDHETGVFRFVSQAHHNKHQNTIHGIRQIKKLFEASFEASPYYLPVNETEQKPEDTIIDCPVKPKVFEMYEPPYVRDKPWLPEQNKLKPREPYHVFRVFPFGWNNEQVTANKQ